jgi:hypothetical protein
VRVERHGEEVRIVGSRGDAHRVRAVMEYGALAVAALLAPARAAGLPLSEMWLSGPATGATSGLYAAQLNVRWCCHASLRRRLRGVPRSLASVLASTPR